MSYWFHIDEGVIEIEPGFRDMSAQVLEWRTRDGGVIALTIQREDFPGEPRDLDALVDDAVADYARGFRAFALDERRVVDGAPFPMRLVRFRWAGEGGLVSQVQAFVMLGQRLLVETATSAAPLADEAERLVLKSLTSMRLRER